MTVEPCDPAEVRIERGADSAATERILRALPEWFGLEQSLLAYVEAAGRLPGYLARLGDDVVGVLLVQRHFPGAAEIHLMAVDAAHHRAGIGRRLVAADGVRLLQVKTLGPSDPDPSYQGTRGFYAAMGFAPLEELPDLWPGNPCLILVKTLGPV